MCMCIANMQTKHTLKTQVAPSSFFTPSDVVAFSLSRDEVVVVMKRARYLFHHSCMLQLMYSIAKFSLVGKKALVSWKMVLFTAACRIFLWNWWQKLDILLVLQWHNFNTYEQVQMLADEYWLLKYRILQIKLQSTNIDQ